MSRVGWLSIAALLVLGPLAFNLAREPGFKASVVLVPQAVAPFSAIQDPRYYRSLLADPELREQMKLHTGKGVSDVTIRSGPKSGLLTVTGEEGTPASAEKFMNALGPQIVNATKRQLAPLANQDAEGIRERLLSIGVSADSRPALERRLRRLKDLAALRPPRVLLGTPGPTPPINRWTDQLVDDLPGDFPARPNPAWAALAGLFVAAALWATCRVLFPPGGRRADAGAPQSD